MCFWANLNRLKQAEQHTIISSATSRAAMRFLAGRAAASSSSVQCAGVEPQQLHEGTSTMSSPRASATARVDSL